MNGTRVRSAISLLYQTFSDVRQIAIALGISVVLWAVAEVAGRNPDIAEAGWIFFCAMGVLLHRDNLTEVYADRQAVMAHPSSNDADLRNIGDHIRGEWIRIATKSLFMIAGAVSLYFPPRINETMEAFRIVSLFALMLGVALLDTDAVLDKIGRRRLVVMLIAEMDARPLGLSAEERLARAVETARDTFHGTNEELQRIVGFLEIVRASGCSLPEGADVAEAIAVIDRLAAQIKVAHALVRQFDPKAGGPSRATQTEG